MPGPFIFIATNKVREGKLEGEKQARLGGSTSSTPTSRVSSRSMSTSARTATGRSFTETLEGTTNIRIYGVPSSAILEMLSQAAGSGVPTTVLPEHLGGFTR
jgi:hypothetical protein